MAEVQKRQIAVKRETVPIHSKVTEKQYSACTVERKIGGITYVITTEQSHTATETWHDKMMRIVLETARVLQGLRDKTVFPLCTKTDQTRIL